ncbi:MAG: copper amine oxidase N-terminal domain-containing protein [Firmicutes bacterium]|nr:copper amine oxidase N-terminal domain-containing protein [Bacillota bacterium]
MYDRFDGEWQRPGRALADDGAAADIGAAAAADCPCSGAGDCPDGEQIAEAQQRDGYTYLPVRTIFEKCNASVNWDAATRTVTAVRVDGAVLYIDTGNDTASLTAQGETKTLDMTGGCYVADGVTYLPLRFVAENLLCKVEWQEWDRSARITKNYLAYSTRWDGYGHHFVLDLATGDFSRTLGGEVELLGTLELPELSDYVYLSSMNVKTTETGNYLVRCGGISSGAVTMRLEFYGWVPAAGGECYSTYLKSHADALPEPTVLADVVWLPDGERIDESTGQAVAYDLKALYNTARTLEFGTPELVWTDDRYMLLSDGSDFVLYDTANKSGVDLTTLLLTDEVKVQVNTFLHTAAPDYFSTEEQFASFWADYGRTSSLYTFTAVPYMQFTAASDGVICMNLRCPYYYEEPDGISMLTQSFPLFYYLPQ